MTNAAEDAAAAAAAADGAGQRPPVTVAGGWGAMNVTPKRQQQETTPKTEQPQFVDEEKPSSSSDDDDNKDDSRLVTKDVDDAVVEGVCCVRSSYATFMENLERAAPRTYNVFFKVLLPVFLIIPVAILCGYFLAKIEAPAEKEANDAAMADYLTNYGRVQDLALTIERKKRACEESYFDATGTDGEIVTVNMTEYRAHVKACDLKYLNETIAIKDDLQGYLLESMVSTVTFNWITCEGSKSDFTYDYQDGRGPIRIYENTTRLEADQRGYFGWSWMFDFVDKWGRYAEAEGEENVPTMDTLFSPSGMTLDTDTASMERAIADASGTQTCTTNVAGGAIFWWTIMTTVGYGNTAPTTSGGRALVYTLGFVTILAFTAIIGQAGYVTLAVFDDLFVRLRLKRLVKGWISVLFWLSMMILWFLVVAAIAQRRNTDKYVTPVAERGNPAENPDDYKISFSDAFWFSFITGTTVGLGDFHIKHDLMTIGDMFYIPLVVLGSFVLLSNFLFKLSDKLMPYFEEGDELHAILEKTRVETADIDGEPMAEQGKSGDA